MNIGIFRGTSPGLSQSYAVKDFLFQKSYDIDESKFGQREWMTARDVLKLKKMYMCERKCVFFPH